MILILLSVFYVLAGASNAGFNKYIVSQKAFGRKFSHSWFLNLIMFIGESMGIPVYYILFKKKEENKPLLIVAKKDEDEEKKEEEKEGEKGVPTPDEEEEEKKPEINKFLLAIRAFTDTCSTGLANIGLILLPASIYQMLKGSLIIMTFLMSKFYIKNKHILDHYIAIPVSTLGVILVGLSAYMNAAEDEEKGNKDASDASQTLLGIILMLLAMFILSIQFCFDEYFMRKYKCHPLICIGYQGVFGFFINLFLCFVFYFINVEVITIMKNLNIWWRICAPGMIKMFIDRKILFSL